MTESLFQALHRGVAGDAAHAAIDLLDHAAWLARVRFRACITMLVDQRSPVTSTPAVAHVDWDAVPGAVAGVDAPDSHFVVLDLAHSLATGRAVDLRAVTERLSSDDLGAVALAVLRAGGQADAIVRWPKPPRYPPGIGVIDSNDQELQSAADPATEAWQEWGWDWPSCDQ